MNIFDDDDAFMDDWLIPEGTFFSLMTSDAIAARPLIGFESEKYGALLNSNQNGLTLSSAGDNNEASNLGKPKSTSRGGLAERVAARAGFNVPVIDTECIIKPRELFIKKDVQSPYLTIPAGLSPTALLDSPVFLSNELAESSPTTGKFHVFPSESDPDPVLMTEKSDKGKENIFENLNASSYESNNAFESDALAHFDASNNSSFPSVDVTDHSEQQSTDTLKLHSDNNDLLFELENFSGSHAEGNTGGTLLSDDQNYFSVEVTENFPPFDEQLENGDRRSSEQEPNNVVGRAPAEDGYHWRKYGQKHVKGSEYPRSYHKCTYLNCPVKKKVERSQEGHITEIIYKGAHNHPKPPLINRRSTFGSLGAFGGEMQVDSEQHESCVTSDLIWSVLQGGNNLEFSNGAATNLPALSGSQSGDAIEDSLILSNYEDSDRATRGSVSLRSDIEVDESESKKRRIENYVPGCGATRAVREPRVVVQTTSEVDILDDGYRWRKYGQKVVKGNPNPRSYYKCTSPGCNVRKHVERAAQDIKSVLTTYEGKHNHEVPAARNSGNANSGGPNTQQVPGTTDILRPEQCLMRGRSAWYDRPQLNSFGLPSLPLMSPGFGFGMNQAGSTSFRPQHGSFSGNQSQSENEMGYNMLPNDDFRMEPVMDSGLNSAVGPSYYQQLIDQMPLGPQM